MSALKKGKGLLAVLLVFVMAVSVMSVTALAAGTTVRVGGTTLKEGTNEIGGGIATLDTAAGTLTLEDVNLGDVYVNIQADGEFTVIVEGTNSIGSDSDRTAGSAIYSSSTLNLEIAEGAVLSIYSDEGNNIYVGGGNLNISGPGKIVADTTGYPCFVANKDLTLSSGLTADLMSDWHGIYTENGDITINSANLTIAAGGVGIFAQTYNESEDTEIPSAVTIKNSSVNITADGDAAVFCGTGGIIVDDTVLSTECYKGDASDDYSYASYSLYSEGNITISGDNTVINADDGGGISADEALKIEGGTVNVDSSNGALFGWNGITISGGNVNVSSVAGSAILAREGALNITGENTSVTATSNDASVATVRNFKDGGIYLDMSYIDVANTADGKPFEGVKKDKSVAITFGDGVEFKDIDVYTTADGHSYFIPSGGDGNTPLTGTAEGCRHIWGEPVWTWAEDNSEASAVFTCANNAEHTETVAAKVTSETTDATCAVDGKTVYTANVTFEGREYSDTKTTVIPAVDEHTWGEPVWTWSEDNKSATATFTCTVNAEHTKTVPAKVTSSVTDASCGAEGKTVYSASVTLDGKDYTVAKTVVIPATGRHTYKDGKCTVCGAADPNYKPAEPETNPNVPQTGDSAVTMIAAAMAIIGCAAAICVVLPKKRAGR